MYSIIDTFTEDLTITLDMFKNTANTYINANREKILLHTVMRNVNIYNILFTVDCIILVDDRNKTYELFGLYSSDSGNYVCVHQNDIDTDGMEADMATIRQTMQARFDQT
jgi:hypothetical protein